MKTLEGQLLMIRNGERVSLSTRVAELDTMLPQYLGVSKAVLDNVIFCHQDESLWPLSEPSTLKKKFDEIFEALKYTKAIDNIKVLRKKQVEELGKLKIIEAHAKDDKDKGERAEKRSHALADEIEVLKTKIKDLNRQTNEAQEKTNEAYKKATEFHAIMATLDTKRLVAGFKQSAIDDFEARGRDFIMRESDAQLKTMLDQYEEKAQSYDNDLNAQMAKYTELGNQLQTVERQIGHKQTEQGKYQADKDEFGRQQSQREKQVKEAARRHNIRGFDHELASEEVQDFMERLNKMKRDQIATRDRAMDENNQQYKAAQEEVNALNQKKSAHSAAKENARGNMKRIDQKTSTLQNTLDRIKVDEGARVALESRTKAIEKSLQQARAELQTANHDKQIQDLAAEIQKLDVQSAALSDELVQATDHAAETARVDNVRKSLHDNELSLDTMQGAHSDRITKTLGNDWAVETLDSVFNNVLKSQDSGLKDVEQQRDGMFREVEATATKRTALQAELNAKRTTAEECQQQVRDVLNEEDLNEYETVVRNLETSRDVMREDSGSFAALEKYYQDCLKTMTNNNCCRLCERDFRTDKEKAAFEKKMSKLMAKAASETVAEDLAATDEELKALKAVRSSYDTWKRLTESEIPGIEVEVRRLNTAYSDLTARLEEKDGVVAEHVASKRNVESIASTVQHIKGYVEAIVRAKEELAELSSKQSQSVVLRGLQEILNDQRSTKQESDKIRADMGTLTSDRDRVHRHIGSLDLEALEVKSKLTETAHKLQEKASLAAQIEDLRSQIKEQKDIVDKIELEGKKLGPQIAQAQAKLDDVEQRGDDQRKQLDEERAKLDSSIRDLKTAEEWINNYLDRGGEQRLARSQRDLEALQEEQGLISSDRVAMASSINQLRDQKSNHINNKDKIDQNIRYRSAKRDLVTVQAEITDLESHDAESDHQKWSAEAGKWQNKRNGLSSEQASVMGEIKSKDNQLKELLRDWNTDYKDAPHNFIEAMVKVTSTQAVVEDLARYGGALDKAIMKFHSLKMEEINRIIDELWKRTYRGTDVDTILIRSDNETGKGTKSYNYRVCMLKQDAEMDMRGRCSAGQKVLASIIIRLALAECFGVACGLIALDEPTTNLDRDNIRALAQSLHNIIKERRRQSNFQLIVITHDEEFLREMQCSEFCERYYRVSRDERQKSIIERQDIALVME